MSLLFFLCSDSFAGWKKIAQFRGEIHACFIFNEQRVLIGGENGQIERTYDGGITWTDCITPPGYFGYVEDIFMKDSLNGWAGIEQDDKTHGLWFTNDGGVTWAEKMNIQSQVTSVYQTKAAVIFGDRIGSNRLSTSVNGGSTFVSVTNDRVNGINFVDDLHGVCTVFRADPPGFDPPPSWTNDGGISWHKSFSFAEEAWGVYANKGTPNFVVAGELYAGYNNQTENVFTSNDYGISWITHPNAIPSRTTGHIAGVGNVIYVQAEYSFSQAFTGLYRSTDGGQTWVGVKGPTNYRDTRFGVTGCLGGVVYAFDAYGSVYKTTDGGDGQIHEPPHNPNISPDHADLTANMCNFLSIPIDYYNMSCNPLTIESISFIDSTDPTVSTGALSFDRYPKLPQILRPTNRDFLSVQWIPKKLGVAKPNSLTYVKIHSTMAGGTIVFDTLIPISTESFSNKPVVALSANEVQILPLNICDRSVDTVLSFTNFSCDSLQLDSANLASDQAWQLIDPLTNLPFKFPMRFAVNETKKFLVRFKPSTVGSELAKVALHFSYQGFLKDTSVLFSTLSFRKMNVQVDTIIALGKQSICTTVDTAFTLLNSNCDTLIIDGITNDNATIFSETNSIQLPYYLPPGKSLKYRLRYSSLKNVTSAAYIRFTYHIDTDSGVWSSVISGEGIAGSSQFITAPNAPNLSFPDRLACSTPDSLSFTISNLGCDSLTVNAALLSAAGLPAINVTTVPSLPVVLSHPSDVVKVTITLDESVPSINVGDLLVAYRLSNKTTVDTNHYLIRANVNRGLRSAIVSHASVDMGSGALCVNRDTVITISNMACPELTVNQVTVSGNYFMWRNPIPLPFKLKTGDSKQLRIEFLPTTSGVEVGSLDITTDADNQQQITIPLTASTKIIDDITFKLVEINSTTLHSGDTAVFAIVANRDWVGEPIKALDFSITTNSDLLNYVNKIKQTDPSFQTIATPVSVTSDMTQLNVQLTAPTAIPILKDSPIVSFYYSTALANQISTPVTLSLLTLNDNDVRFRNCILTPSSVDADFVLNLECGANTLIDWMHNITPLTSSEARPNPVTSSTDYQSDIPYLIQISGLVVFRCYDALGKQIQLKDQFIDRAGYFSMHFNGRDLPGGMYHYSLQSGSTVVRGRLLLLK
ncbi:MAG: choice-of-anchor D domain-containing protein [bacterium]